VGFLKVDGVWVFLTCCRIGLGKTRLGVTKMSNPYPSALRVIIVFGILGPLFGGLGLGALLAQESQQSYEWGDIAYRCVVVGVTSLVMSVLLSVPYALAIFGLFRGIAQQRLLTWGLRGGLGLIARALFWIYPFVLGYRRLELLMVALVVGFTCGIVCRPRIDARSTQ
jgi:hypothetical protein